MSQILYAKNVIDEVLPQLKQEVSLLVEKGITPKLSVILVGNNPASLSYIKNKKKFCEKIGAHFELTHLNEDIDEDSFLAKVKEINDSPEVTGCFVQLPIPKHLQHIEVTQLINPDKDVDGFHFNSIQSMYLNKRSAPIPCTPKGIITLLKKNNIEIEGKSITVIGRSYIVGRPLSILLNNYNATVSLCHSKTRDLLKHTRDADIIISAVGVPNLIKKEHLSENKNQIIIDVGMNKFNGKLVGDVDFDEVKDHVHSITPVPGGVGPMTVLSLMENLITTSKNLLNKKE